MKSKILNNIGRTAALVGVLMTTGVSYAADVYLQAIAYDKDLIDGDSIPVDTVPMWGFVCDPTAPTDNLNCDASTTGSPQINVTAGDSLTIHLSNTLTTTPVSVVIPGLTQVNAGAPVPFTDAQGRTRVQSFTHEALAGGATSYTWSSLRTGTYLYQSGTHPSIQVPMGLYGALVITTNTGDAYASVSTDTDTVMLFSEIDPVQNAAVKAAEGDVTMYPSTVDYSPTYLLVNGELSPAAPSLGDGTSTNTTALLRLLNAGQRTHTPSLVGIEMALIAEDGNLYRGLPRRQSTVMLPAGKTLDALVGVADSSGNLVIPAEHVTFGLFDHMPGFNNADLPNGGIVANLDVGDGSPAGAEPRVRMRTYSVVEDDPGFFFNPPGGGGIRVVSGTSNGTLVASVPAGAFTYTPNPDFSGSDHFAYYRPGNNTTYEITLNVSFLNDAPVAGDDGPYFNTIGSNISVAAPGVLGNDADADGDTLTAHIVGRLPAGLTLNSDGSFEYILGRGRPIPGFSYRAEDSSGMPSNVVVVPLRIAPVSNISLTVQDPNGTAVTDYRWVVEEDTTWQPDPSDPQAESLATNFHKSYMPVVAQGCAGTRCDPLDDVDADDGTAFPNGLDDIDHNRNGILDQSTPVPFNQLALNRGKHYYVSVLPSDAHYGAGGHTIGGARIPPGASEVTVNVNLQELETAQISVIVFEDNSPTNGAVDGGETGNGLAGFQITLEDAGGRYGISAGQLLQDVDGLPLKNWLPCFDGGAQPEGGVIVTCPDTEANRNAGIVGEALIKNLFPGKYGVIATPPVGQTNDWSQTSTIEGTKVIDAWVKSGEPPFFQEFGPGIWHAFVGFVNKDRLATKLAVICDGIPDETPPTDCLNSVEGQVTNMHMSRPPNQVLADSGSYAALAHTRAWVGLNSAGGLGDNIAAVQADEEGNFMISNVPDGLYQLVVWDKYLDQVLAYKSVELSGGGTVDINTIPVFQWFARSEHNVFLDDGCGIPGSSLAGNGKRDDCGGGVMEAPLAEQAVNLRWRDGTVNQSFPTDLEGFVPFDQTFPFFSWQVLEVDYTRFEATGLTTTVDAGGVINPAGPHPGLLEPQIQADGAMTRTETGQVLTQGFQGFLGQTSIFDWGKRPYPPGKNGGISGIVYYPSTRAENDPRKAAAEPWEPGIPGVTVRLYREVNTQAGGTALALVAETTTDNWDESLPTGCPGADLTDQVIHGGPVDKCYDGLRNFNQARPAVFDGGYAFNDIPAGEYVVEVAVPTGYDLMKEEDNNVGYGDAYSMEPEMMCVGGVCSTDFPGFAEVEEVLDAEPGIAQPACVGAMREVPPFLSLFPGAYEPAPYAGAMRPLCDRKKVILSDQGQSAADFFLLTGAPISAHFTGMVLDDLAQEFNIYSPQFGEKWAPPFVPVSFKDHNGVEISRVYSDQWGRINGLVPSTYSANMPSPSGFSPAMHIACMNDPGPLADGSIDPQYNPAYSNFCYTFQYMPGTTTYLDTPVLPISAFASGDNPPYCSFDQGTPMIRQVDGTGSGPWVDSAGGTQTLTITSLGTDVEVLNPAYEGPLATGLAGQKLITRDYGFGSPGSVTVGGTPLAVTSWNPDTIIATVPAGVSIGELVVTRANGNSTTNAVTVTVSDETPIRVTAGVPGAIQAAIDGASPGDLILVGPGTYNELVIMWQPVRLQGAGAGSTLINAVKAPTEKIAAWRTRMDSLFGTDNALPTQPTGSAGFNTEEGAAITVFGSNSGVGSSNFMAENVQSRIDGFSITGGDIGGGIFVNSYAHKLEIANNDVFGNSGSFGGGIRVGRPILELTDADLTSGTPTNLGAFGFNTNVNIHDNTITRNGGLGGAGGGLSIATGSDNYNVSGNFVCGNFTTGDGAGIGHLGLSDNGVIAHNRIVFNQSFSQATTRSGGGLLIAGEPSNVDGLSFGSGNVLVDSNLIQGNHAGAGHGGGVRTQFVNGREIAISNRNDGRPRLNRWHRVTLNNNMIVNNVAGWGGGGVSLQDTARSFIVNNTIAHNDSTATVSAAFTLLDPDTGRTDPNKSANQPAGVSSEPHSPGLGALLAALPAQNSTNALREYSNPSLRNNIVWRNRTFHYDALATPADETTAGLVPVLTQANVGDCDTAAEDIWDFGLVSAATGGEVSRPGDLEGPFRPFRSVLTDTQGYSGNTSANPNLVNAYCNGGRTLVSTPGPMAALPALDEGGATWIDVRFGPLTQTWPLTSMSPTWDYHVGAGSAVNRGRQSQAPDFDFDGEARPATGAVDAGADERT